MHICQGRNARIRYRTKALSSRDHESFAAVINQMLGEHTAGYVCGGSYKRISEESMLLYCASMLVIDGKRLEGAGVEPDIHVPFDIRFAGGKDIQLQRAKDEMVRLIEYCR